MPVATRRQLLEAGVHFGHQTRRWNPKMRRYIFGERSGIYIIDLEKSLTGLTDAYNFLVDVARRNGTVLFVGTKKQAQEAVAEQASRVNMPYVNTRWLGGMLTNFQTIHGRLQRMRELREMERSGAFEFLPKKEVLKLRHEKEKLERNLAGIQDMERLPNAVFVIDTKREHIAVTEARKLGIPVIAIVDTNCDPDEVDYVVPGNDDAIRSCSLVAKVVADAIQEGQYLAYQGMQSRPTEPEFEQEAVPASFSAGPGDERRTVRLSEEEAAFLGAAVGDGASGVASDGESAGASDGESAATSGGEEDAAAVQEEASEGAAEPAAAASDDTSVPAEPLGTEIQTSPAFAAPGAGNEGLPAVAASPADAEVLEQEFDRAPQAEGAFNETSGLVSEQGTPVGESQPESADKVE